ncbi:unnamed protein product [Paramecium sonneborni]|uniref:Uncharacterized protein n=1 Tax=Paramecium sonneborni TaxID=65129 RepID=A0A8S1KXV1_9CILI|nr:unnamed protein product [Paramecium sonneborni]
MQYYQKEIYIRKKKLAAYIIKNIFQKIKRRLDLKNFQFNFPLIFKSPNIFLGLFIFRKLICQKEEMKKKNIFQEQIFIECK